MTAKEHNRLAGIFLLAHGGMQALMMLILCVVYGVMGILFASAGRRGEGPMMGVIFIGMVVLLAIIGTVMTLPQIIGGIKLLKERPNARNWAIVGSIISCLSFPLGTAAGVYGLWFLFGEVGKQYYLGGAPVGQPMFEQPKYENQPAPPPNSWQ